MHASILESYLAFLIEFVPEISADNNSELGLPEDDDGLSEPDHSLLLTDSKLFWRTQETFVLDFYMHSNHNCLELVVESSEAASSGCGAHQIFFDAKLLAVNVQQLLQSNIKTIKAMNEAMAGFVIERLYQDKEHQNAVVYQPLSSDPADICPLMPHPPARMVFAKSNERRIHKSSSTAIHAAVTGLEGESEMLKRDTHHAEKLADRTSDALRIVENIVLIPPKYTPDVVRQVSSGDFTKDDMDITRRKSWRSSQSVLTPDDKLKEGRTHALGGVMMNAETTLSRQPSRKSTPTGILGI